MWNWIYGLSISLFFLLRELGNGSKFIQVIPLFFPLVLGFLLNQPPNKQRKHFYGFVSLLVVANIYNVLNNNTFFASLTVGIVGLIVIHLSMEEEPMLVNSSTYITLLAKLSQFILLVTYATFYGVEINYFKPEVPIFPLFIHIIAEIVIIYMLYKGDKDIQEQFSTDIMFTRIVSTVCTTVVFLMGIVHYFEIISDLILYLSAFIFYVAGFFIAVAVRYKKLGFEKCFCHPRYKKLKNEQKDIDIDFPVN